MVLGRAEIIRAIRIRKLLEQADAETGPAAGSYRDKARRLAGAHPHGRLIRYKNRPFPWRTDDGH